MALPGELGPMPCRARLQSVRLREQGSDVFLTDQIRRKSPGPASDIGDGGCVLHCSL